MIPLPSGRVHGRVWPAEPVILLFEPTAHPGVPRVDVVLVLVRGAAFGPLIVRSWRKIDWGRRSRGFERMRSEFSGDADCHLAIPEARAEPGESAVGGSEVCLGE